MNVLSYVGCALLAGAAGGTAGWWTVRRMLGGGSPRGSTMRRWPGPGGSHAGSAEQAPRRLGRARRRRRWR